LKVISIIICCTAFLLVLSFDAAAQEKEPAQGVESPLSGSDVLPPANNNPAPVPETKPTRAERAEAFRQKLLADKTSVLKLHKAGVQVSYLVGLKWKVFPNECKEIILISSSHQRLIKFVDGLPKFVYVCSTRAPWHGRERFGFYKILSHEKKHWSTKVHVWMPWAMQFDDNVFVHETKKLNKLGQPDSLGCIRLNGPNAKELWYDTKLGTPAAYLK